MPPEQQTSMPKIRKEGTHNIIKSRLGKQRLRRAARNEQHRRPFVAPVANKCMQRCLCADARAGVPARKVITCTSIHEATFIQVTHVASCVA